jgi:hypothetical protein
MIGCLVGDMIPESKVGLRARRNADKALVGLDLANGAPGEPLYTGFKVGPQNVPFPLAGDRGVHLKMVNASQGGSRVGVYHWSVIGKAGSVLHGDG